MNLMIYSDTYHLMCTVIGFLMSDFISCFTVSFFDISQTSDCQNKQQKINFNPPVIKKLRDVILFNAHQEREDPECTKFEREKTSLN